MQDDFMLSMLEEYPAILLPKECMEILGIGRSMFYKLVGSGELPAKRVGKLWRVSKADIISYMREH